MRKLLPTIIEASHVDLQTPDDKNEQISEMNEIWLPCSICQERVNLCSLMSHKQCHKANRVLKSKAEDSLHIITLRKKEMVSQIEISSEYKYREQQKINHSYETLKGKLLYRAPYTSKMCMPCEDRCHVYDMDGNGGLVKSIVICSAKNSSWQSCMEDSFTVLNNYGQRKNTCFAGIFDGHHGNVAAVTAAAELPVLLLDHISVIDPSYKLNEEEKFFIRSFDSVFKDNYRETEQIFSTEKKKGVKETDVEDIHRAYAKAFWRMDRMLQLGRKESSKSRWSGCSVVTCLIEGLIEKQMLTDKDKTRLGMLHVANIGNIKAVLCKNGKHYCLTREHSTTNSQERKRVLESGGYVSSNESRGLVEGFGRFTRALGFHGDPQLKNAVIPAPHTISIPISNACQFLILASIGLWEILSPSEVVAMAQDLLTTFLMCPHDVNPRNMNTEEDLQSESKERGLQDDPESHVHLCAKPDILENNSSREPKADNKSKLYRRAAVCVCKQIMKAAMLAGSLQNITVCLILLPGCEARPFS